MTDGFIRKKVESLTLGEKLIKLRSQYRMSLLEISKATRIQVKYLEALESGDHRGLPAEVYVRGFLRSYARYLGLPDDAFIKLYDKEKHIRSHLDKTAPVPERPTTVLQKAWVVTPRTVTFVIIGIILVGTFWYLFRELRSFVAEPHLVVSHPASGFVTSEGTIVVTGRTDPGARIMLNGESVFVTGEGTFEELLTLQPGANTLQITATNRFEKTKEVVVVVENTTTPPEMMETGASVELSASRLVERLTLEIDSVVVWNGPWEGEKREAFTVRKGFKVTTSDPGATLLRVGEYEPRSLGTSEGGEKSFAYTPEELQDFTNTKTIVPTE